jgi:phospholipase/carboxylesterase
MQTKAISEVLHRGPSIKDATKAVILLHGRGGTARHMLGLVDRFCDSSFYVAIPQATHTSWYPHSFMSEVKLNEPNLSASVKEINQLIEQTALSIPKHEIFLIGFSQGACLTLEIAARYATKYAGIISFTGGLIGSTIDLNKYQGQFEGTKMFISNGTNDPHIPLARSEESKEVLESLGADVTLKIYEGRPHTICEDEIESVKKIYPLLRHKNQ